MTTCPKAKPSQPNRPCGGKTAPVSSSAAAQTSSGSGNSVVLATGQFNFALPLMSAAALGAGSWDFNLEYLSNNGIADIAGLGWNYSQNYQLVQLGNGDIALLTPENTLEMFIYNGSGQWLSGYNNSQATLVETNAGTASEAFVLTSNAGVITTFFGFNSAIATPGRMQSIMDRFGNGQTLSWTSVGGVVQLSSVTDAYGRTTNYSYYGSAGSYLLSQVTDFMGRQLNFYYDSASHLTAVVLPSIKNAAAGNTFPDGTAYVFQYDVSNTDPNRQNDLIKIWYPNQTLPYMSSRNVDVASVYANATPRYVIAYGQSTGPAIAYGAVISETVGDPANNVGGAYAFSYSNTRLPANIIDSTDPIVSQTTMTDRNGNVKIFNFNYNGMVVMKQENTNRNKSSLEVGPYITWTRYNDQNQRVLEVLPAGNSIAYTYDSGMIDFGFGPQLYSPRRGLLLSETRLPGNSIGIPSRPGSNGQTQLTTTWFYDPLYNEVCAEIGEKGNPIAVNSGVNVYFTPQNGGSTPTDANRTRYATLTTFDYQKNQTTTITGNTTLQNLLGLTAAQIQSLIGYVSSQMVAGGLPSGFQTNLGNINGDGTGDGNGSGLQASPMPGSVVQVLHPAVYQLVPNPSYPGSGDPWLWQTQTRMELFTNNLKGQTTTATDPEGNLTIYVRYAENNPDGDFDYYDPNLSSNQYGRVKAIHVDANPSTAMTLVGSEGDMVAFTGNIIPRTNTPGVYQSLTTSHQGATGCTTCNYDPLGNVLTTVDARGNLTEYDRTEMGEVYRVTAPAPYSYLVETFYDANRNTTRVDTQDMVVLYTSTDPNDPNYAKFTPSGSGSTANVPLTAGPGGSVRSGWFTNLYTFDLLDNKIEDDIDATGSSPASLISSYLYDPNQNLIQTTRPNGNIVQFDYDERNLRIATRVGYAPGLNPPVAGAMRVNVFDSNGNLLNVIGPVQRGTANNSLSVTIANAFSSGGALTQTGDWVVANTLDGFDRVITATDVVGGTLGSTFDPSGATVQVQTAGTANGVTPTDRTGSGNVLLELVQTRYDEAGRSYENQRIVFLNTGISSGQPTHALPSGRTATHTGGGMAVNSTTNSNTTSVTLTTGGQSYILTRTVFDRAGRAVATGADNGAITTTSYDGADRLIETTDPEGNTTQTTYDGNGNAIGVTRTDQCTIASTIPTESFGALLMYDVMNQLVVRADQGADGTLSGNFTDPSTLFTFHGYNSRGLETNLIDPKQNTTILVYDGAGRQLQTQQNLRTGGSGVNPVVSTVLTQQGFDANSNMVRLVDSNSGTTVWAFDTLDRAVSETYQDGSIKKFSFDYANDVVEYTDCNGSVFTNTWDCMGRKTNTTISAASGIGGTTAQSFQHDGLGRITFARDTVGTLNADVTMAYDSSGRTVEEAQTYGGNTRFVTSTQFTSLPATQFEYPNNRLVNSEFDALYRRSQIIEQATGAAIADWQFFGLRLATVTLGNGLVCSNMNNAQNRSAIQSGLPTPPWGSITTDQLGYDGAGRMIGKRYFSGGNVLVGFTAGYDESSNKLFERPLHAEERSSLYDSYDSMNRLLDYQRGVLASGGGSVTTSITLPGTDSSRNYDLDALGNWSDSTFTPVGGSSTVDQRNHNKLNQIIQQTLTGGVQTSFLYDLNGNLTGKSDYVSLVLAANPALYWRLGEAGGSTAFDASTNGQNGVYSGTGITYGEAGALPNFTNTAVGINTGSVVSEGIFNFPQVTVAAWVKLNAVPTVTELLAGMASGVGGSMYTNDLYVSTNGAINWYMWDGAGHLLFGPGMTVGQWYYVVGTANGTTTCLYMNGVLVASASAGNAQTGFTVPNFLVSGGCKAFGGTLNAQVDEVAVYNYALSAAQVSGQYAAASGQPQVRNRYDAFNRLNQVSDNSNGQVLAQYLYDATNRRVRKTITNGGVTGNIPNGTTDYVWQGWQVAEERNPFGGTGSADTPIRQYVWGQYIDECIQLTTLVPLGAQNLAAGSYYLLQDLLYRAVALTNSSGQVVEAYDTDAYGNTLVLTGPGADGVWFTDDDLQSSYGANDTIFQGRQYDPETQLYYFRTRYYVPALGRFVDRNPWGYIQGRYDLYDFEKCNPLSFVEPFSVAIIIVEAVVLVVAGVVTVIYVIQMHGHRVRFPTYCPSPPNPCPGLIKDFAKAYLKFVKAAREVVDDNRKLGGWPGPPRGSPEWMKLYYERAKTLKELFELTKELNDVSKRMKENGC